MRRLLTGNGTATPPHQSRRGIIERSSPWSRLEWGALGLVTLAAGIIRLAGLNRPTSLVFDEIFYARDACWYVVGTEAVCNITDVTSRAHPPLGKWLVGSGIAVFGYDPFGWRVAAALAGTLTVALVFVLAWRLIRPVTARRATTVGALMAAGLLATDFLHVVHSRVAMLDIFITLFVVTAVLAIVLDRDRPREAAESAWSRLALGRPWRLAAGLALGAAAATKWSGAYVALAVIGLTIAWVIAAERRRRDSDWRGALLPAVRREALPTAILLGLVPLAVYFASYIGRMPGELLAAPWAAGSVWRNLYAHQQAMLEFHTTLGGHHPYESPPWSWVLLKRPVAYWFSDEGGA
ncbi:MAG: phospholipid carrier-dependent glycosyltransferase, partial [Dehalococcoidia bacterium]